LVHHDAEGVHRLHPARKVAIELGHAKPSTSGGGCLIAMLGTTALVLLFC
jgi:hypothetical protein